MTPSNHPQQESSNIAYIATLGDLNRERLCLDLLLTYCQTELKANRRHAYRWVWPNNTLVHMMLAQTGHAARKQGILYPFVGIGFFLLMALLSLPLTLCFQITYNFMNQLCSFADWLRDLRKIQQLRLAIQEHRSACGDIYTLWRKLSPSRVDLSRYGSQSLLADWLSILYGGTSGDWAQKLDSSLERQASNLANNHAAFIQGEAEIRLLGHPTPWLALRALSDEIPERYLS